MRDQIYKPTSQREADWYLERLVKHLEKGAPLERYMEESLIDLINQVREYNSKTKNKKIFGVPRKRDEKTKNARELIQIYALSELFLHKALHMPANVDEMCLCEELAMIEERTLARYRNTVKNKMRRSKSFKDEVNRATQLWRERAERQVKIRWQSTTPKYFGLIDFSDPKIRDFLVLSKPNGQAIS